LNKLEISQPTFQLKLTIRSLKHTYILLYIVYIQTNLFIYNTKYVLILRLSGMCVTTLSLLSRALITFMDDLFAVRLFLFFIFIF